MNVFDIVGPVMIGPSSSHTAGAARIGLIARALLGAPAVTADIRLHGSFAKTYRGHGTDKALVAGILGMKPDDARRQFDACAEKPGWPSPSCRRFGKCTPNTALITLTDAQGHTVSVQGASVGGGNILVTRVNGMAVEITGQYTTLIVLHRDAPGTIAAVTEEMSRRGVNICNFRLSRAQKGGTAVMTIEVDGALEPDVNSCVEKLPNVLSSTMLAPM
ncbi:MAG: L-serine ammonia-lyase, iron-sulfur-dependent subunit beta [Ruthenibacterium lactatiformans]